MELPQKPRPESPGPRPVGPRPPCASTRRGAAPNVLLNDYFDAEIHSSQGIPLAMWFAKRLNWVSLWLGTIGRGNVTCAGGISGRVPIPHWQEAGDYRFSVPIVLSGAGRTFTVLAENSSGLKGSAQTTLTLGEPTASVPMIGGSGFFRVSQPRGAGAILP